MTLQSYHDLIARKAVAAPTAGFADVDEGAFPVRMFDHQRHGTAFALRTGRSALFYDTGLGKTGMELVWGSEVASRTNGKVLMACPLAVGPQHVDEAGEWGVDAAISRDGRPAKADVTITNIERLHLFDPADYAGAVIDESSILKNFTGATSRKLIAMFDATPYRLAASATPAPNDHTELGQHSAFLSVMESPEMLSRWFISDQMEKRYRLKKPAIRPFWDWVASWARCVAKPSDIGFSDAGFVLPELTVERHVLAADRSIDAGVGKDGQMNLIRVPDTSATSIHREKRLSAEARAEQTAAIVAAEPGEAWNIWLDTDYEADALAEALPDMIDVRGSMRIEEKEEKLIAFTRHGGVLATKPSIGGYGLNWQHCARFCFMGFSFSYENYYQAIRRNWRFGQKRPVRGHLVCTDAEEAQWRVVSRKQGDHDAMKAEMTAAMRRAAKASQILHSYFPEQEARLPAWFAR